MSEQMSVTIGYITERDFEAWLPLWKGYQTFYEVDLSEAVTKTTWQRFLDASQDPHCIVARIGDEVVGFAHFLFHTSTWAESEYCYLEDLYVLPEVRGQQVGKQLIEHLAEIAKARGCARVYWHTQESNHRAQRLYNWIADKPGMVKYLIPLA